MPKRFLAHSDYQSPSESNIFADKSALILQWLLARYSEKGAFSLRQVSQETGVSLGQTQKVLGILLSKGVLMIEGIRTRKKFFLKNAPLLLSSWIEHYDVTKKCKIRSYRSGMTGKKELLHVLRESNLSSKVSLALHSAAEASGYKNNNLDTLELYLLDPTVRIQLEEILQLEPQERGYEVLLIEPYYKAWLKRSLGSQEITVAPELLTFLDLFHFPLRGREQAEFMAARHSLLKQLYKAPHD